MWNKMLLSDPHVWHLDNENGTRIGVSVNVNAYINVIVDNDGAIIKYLVNEAPYDSYEDILFYTGISKRCSVNDSLPNSLCKIRQINIAVLEHIYVPVLWRNQGIAFQLIRFLQNKINKNLNIGLFIGPIVDTTGAMLKIIEKLMTASLHTERKYTYVQTTSNSFLQTFHV